MQGMLDAFLISQRQQRGRGRELSRHGDATEATFDWHWVALEVDLRSGVHRRQGPTSKFVALARAQRSVTRQTTESTHDHGEYAGIGRNVLRAGLSG